MATDETLVEIRNFKGLKIVYKKKKQRNIQELRNILSYELNRSVVNYRNDSCCYGIDDERAEQQFLKNVTL